MRIISPESRTAASDKLMDVGFVPEALQVRLLLGRIKSPLALLTPNLKSVDQDQMQCIRGW